ncbi:ead/Ea22-like family protein [Enterobacter roggenkampii]|uniref:ead/Ea22-like family protein n=1 Tax=Enterobacter roggenkampii TaxID=1812935 RepID=UPI003B84176F
MSNIDKQALRERYSEKPAPKCHICGSVMTIQRAGAGGVVYGCTGRIDKDGEGYKFAEGRDFADDHYARSRVTVADESDPDVLALLDELEAADALNKHLELAIRKAEGCSEALRRKAEAAEKRIAELERKEQHSDRQSVIDALASSGEEWSDIEEYMQKWDAERASAAGKGE